MFFTKAHAALLASVHAMLVQLTTKEMPAMSTAFAALTAQVNATVAGEQSAITAFQGLAAQFAANADDPVAVTALSQQLNASAAQLAAAVAAPGTQPAPAAPTLATPTSS